MGTPSVAANSEISQLRNLGGYSEQMLNSIGIFTRQDLAAWGAVKPYVLLKAMGQRVSMNFVYAIEAALADTNINQLPPEVKAKLKQQIAAQTNDSSFLPS